MQTKFLSRPLIAAALCAGAVACVDDNYDLSDIDTTTRVNVESLTIPVNIDPVVLSDIITIDEDSKIKSVTIDGKEFYALSESGSFSSEPIHIDKVTAPAPSLPTTTRTLNIAPEFPVPADVQASFTYHITEMGNDINYNAGNIDDAIVELNSASIQPLKFTIDFEVVDHEAKVETLRFFDLSIQLPAGLRATVSTGSYNPANGLWSIDNYEVSSSKASATLTTDFVDFKANGSTIENGSFRFNSRFSVNDGLLTIRAKAGVILPQTIDLKVSYKVDDLTVNSFSGVVKYSLDGMDIAPVDLSDIPDFLSGDETNISLANPQIYLSVNNPVADYSLECGTGLTLTAMRDGADDRTFSPDVNLITIGSDKGVTGPYNFVLAPSADNLTVPAGFGSPKFEAFSTLGGLLSTPAGSAVKGLPDRIGIRLDNPGIKQGPVTDFVLGTDLSGVDGRYELVAPLAFAAGTEVVYTHTEDGWNDDDVDAITITELVVTASGSNATPLNASVTAYPVDVNGNRISGVEIVTENMLAGNSTDSPLRIVLKGVVKHFDGIIFEAHVTTAGSENPISPSQAITLKDIRVTVSGYYEKEL